MGVSQCPHGHLLSHNGKCQNNEHLYSQGQIYA